MLCISNTYKTKNQGNYFFCFSFLDCITLFYWVQLLFLYNYFEYFLAVLYNLLYILQYRPIYF